MTPLPIRIGARTLGSGCPPFVVAELGYSFTSIEEALESVDAAAKSGADAIKLQTFRADTVTSRAIDFPPEAGGGSQYEEFKRYEIDAETHRYIFERARARGIVPFSTPSHAEDVAMLEDLGVELYKIGSDDLTNLPFLRHVAQLGKPIILSSGMATLAEVDEALQVVRATGNEQVVLLQCVSNYPVEDMGVLNLRVIETFRRAFPVHVGYSDHAVDLTPAIVAVALGAVLVERHFVLDRTMAVPDAFFSADPVQMAALVRAVRDAHGMLGDGHKTPAPSEAGMRLYARKSVIARRSILAGQTITAEDLIVKRPATGISPRDCETLIGRVARRDIFLDEAISWDMV